MKTTLWTREETVIAFNVYCKIPFKESSSRHPEIIKHAKIIGRSPASLSMKIGNFGRLDPQLKERGISGLSHGSKMEQEVWDEFHGNWENLIYESEQLIAKFQGKRIEQATDIDCDNLPQGKERNVVVKSRVNQSFFRNTILSCYNWQCCITSLPVPDLLIASHIIPWHINHQERLNPRNGLCLNALHDKAFDRGFITISPDYKIVIANEIKRFDSDVMKNYFINLDNKRIFVPDKFSPQREFLEYHNKNIFRGSD